ncbi:LacI family transcriptional regulator [Paenibacillus pasadenensis]|uniref:LacI family DNA-binding transcriptional regulator n=1 Tax=Paenibacillus pasadenensis TaxID=217090 RepID=UPI0020408BED|nr:LacI family DNA-binding transcriptional regulator [Paenibacillus pasadenensis]MCM3746602.1 LacI family transcriptional regulator [Paenibacillus pasadenensis]
MTGRQVTAVPTLKDIAKLAQVSKSTVSLALAGDSRVSAETRDKIAGIAEQLGYIPNRMARGLSRARSQSLGVLFYGGLGNPLEDFFSDTLMGIGHEALQLGYNVVMLGFSRHTNGEHTDWTDQVIRSGVDGLIVISMSSPLYGFEKLLAMRFPIVFIGKRKVAGAPALKVNEVSSDHFGAGRAAADYLRGLGHSELAVVAPESASEWMEERIHGFFSADRKLLQEMGDRVFYIPEEQTAVFSRMVTQGYTAYFAIAPYLGLSLLQALQQKGFRVPDDVSLLVYDDFPSASLQRPPLTVLKQDMRSLGRLAFQRLIELIADPEEEGKHILISVSLLERNSCGPAHC